MRWRTSCAIRSGDRDLSRGFVCSTSTFPPNNRWPCWSAPRVLVFSYQHSAESSSAAVRFGLSANRPVVCTPLDIFDDVRPAVEVSEDTSSAALARAISAMLDGDASAYRQQVDRQRNWLMKHRGAPWRSACECLSVRRCAKHVSRAAASTEQSCRAWSVVSSPLLAFSPVFAHTRLCSPPSAKTCCAIVLPKAAPARRPGYSGPPMRLASPDCPLRRRRRAWTEDSGSTRQARHAVSSRPWNSIGLGTR